MDKKENQTQRQTLKIEANKRKIVRKKTQQLVDKKSDGKSEEAFVEDPCSLFDLVESLGQ